MLERFQSYLEEKECPRCGSPLSVDLVVGVGILAREADGHPNMTPVVFLECEICAAGNLYDLPMTPAELADVFKQFAQEINHGPTMD